MGRAQKNRTGRYGLKTVGRHGTGPKKIGRDGTGPKKIRPDGTGRDEFRVGREGTGRRKVLWDGTGRDECFKGRDGTKKGSLLTSLLPKQGQTCKSQRNSKICFRESRTETCLGGLWSTKSSFYPVKMSGTSLEPQRVIPPRTDAENVRGLTLGSKFESLSNFPIGR